MKVIGFIGAYSKTNLLLNIAKTLTELENKVLVIDTTKLERSKYVVPSISPTKSYVTSFENTDFALGFEKMADLYNYLGLEKTKELPYDYVLIDVDDGNEFLEFKLDKAEENYFVTSFDLYSLRRGLVILEEIKIPVKLTKVLFSYELRKSDEEYLEYLSNGYNVMWNEYTVYFTILGEDNRVMEENQRVAQVRLKKLTTEYKESLTMIVQDILKDVNPSKIRKIIKG